MKPLEKTLLRAWASIATLIAVWLVIELREAREEIREEIEIRYELSVVVDSLLWEADSFKQYIKEDTKP